MNTIEKIALNKVNQRIAEKIEANFKTLVNSFGVVHRSENEFSDICGNIDGSNFFWVSYFVIPVEIDYELILPKKYWLDTEEFRSSTSIFDINTKYDRDEYYSKLKSYDDLTDFIERHTSGASVVVTKITRNAHNENSSKIINGMDEIEDGGYLYACYFID